MSEGCVSRDIEELNLTEIEPIFNGSLQIQPSEMLCSNSKISGIM